MLTRLRVKNYALIEDLYITFQKGLNILTGATGAGKSILIGSMNLILGEKASLEMVRSGAKEAFVEATFEFSGGFFGDDHPPKSVRQFLLQGDNNLLLRRQVVSTGSQGKEGRSFAFINDKQVTLATLKKIGDVLADLLGQHHHQSLLNSAIHRELLDRFSLDRRLVNSYREAFAKLRKSKQELVEVLEKDKLSKEREELYRFQLTEIDKANLHPGEKESLREERKVLQNVQKILLMVQRIRHSLSGEDDSTLNRLKVLLKEFESLAELDDSQKAKIPQWKDVVFSLEDLAFDLNRYSDSIQADPERLEWIEDRLQLYSSFAKKYGGGYEEIMSYRGEIEQELNNIKDREDQIRELTQKINHLKAEVSSLGKDISRGRKKGAGILKERIENELQELGMKGTKFGVQFTPVSETGSTIEVSTNGRSCFASEGGLEEVEFLISPNPGEPLKPLAKIASGGEISRIMLALKTVLASVDNIPLLIFDEIDVGIGGNIASLVGKKLKKLSQNHQIICITHLQQIASYADNHFRAFKIQKEGRTITEVKELSQDERVREIARMIAGEEITDLSLEHAREFLSGAAEA